MIARITLSEILGRGVSMEWYEGVALVRGVATRLLDTSSDAAAAPELHQIEISKDGDVSVSGATTTTEPVRRFGQLLQATLGHTAMPVQLRLVIVQATAPAPAFGSIREFDEALAYFERPGRDTILEALYTRAAAAPIPEAAPTPTLDAVAPLPSPDPPKAAKRRAPAKSNRRAVLVGAAGVVLLIGATAPWYARRAGVMVGRRDVSTIAHQAADAAGAAPLAGLSAVTERTGLGRLVPATAVSPEPPAVPDTAVAKLSRARQTASPRRKPPIAPILMFDLDPLPHSEIELVAYATPGSAPPGSVAAESVERDENTVFALGSEGVLPPVWVRPQLPRELPPNVKPEQLCRVELVVSENGTVESVKLLGVPHTVHDSMLLSAVKAWQFHPALKDGHSVRFRKTVWFVSR